MDREKQRQIASKGGRAAHAKGTAHEFTHEEAVEAGRKGGRAAQARGHSGAAQQSEEERQPETTSGWQPKAEMVGTAPRYSEQTDLHDEM
jgi:general stress protein YciG